jgi:histidyl-tRNA synthetase
MAEIKKIKPSLPKGTRDFLPEEVVKRNYIFDTIKYVFRKYGFQQIDTPAFERLETLTGKYGVEGDRLLFKILNSGNALQDLSHEELLDYAKKNQENAEFIGKSHAKKIAGQAKDVLINNLRNEEEKINDLNVDDALKIYDSLIAKNKPSLEKEIEISSRKILQQLTEKGLRYDLTVPLARYVVQHQEHLAFPFKRFHIGPVWRADRPQKGRYQEFYQCDADVIGSTSLLNEVELTQIYVEVFSKLKIPVSVAISSRKFLYGFAVLCGAEKDFTAFTTIIDKEDKIGQDKVRDELNNMIYGVGNKYVELIAQINHANENNFKEVYDNMLIQFEAIHCQEGIDGLKEIKAVIDLVLAFGSLDNNVKFTPTLARGLGYYSGIIWEVALDKNKTEKEISMGSLGGGGRYDNLTEMFGGRDMSGVGISFGIERIYDVMEELKLFPAELGETTKVLFVHFDEASEAYAFEQLQKVRAADIASEIYPGKKKLDKQMNYANDKKIPYVVVIGGDEMASGKLTLKNMASGEQAKLSIVEIIERLK